MALAQNLTAAAAPSRLVSQLGTLKAEFDHWRAQRRVYRQTFHELNTLSDRELADLGLNRSNLRGIAKEAAQSM